MGTLAGLLDPKHILHSVAITTRPVDVMLSPLRGKSGALSFSLYGAKKKEASSEICNILIGHLFIYLCKVILSRLSGTIKMAYNMVVVK